MLPPYGFKILLPYSIAPLSARGRQTQNLRVSCKTAEVVFPHHDVSGNEVIEGNRQLLSLASVAWRAERLFLPRRSSSGHIILRIYCSCVVFVPSAKLLKDNPKEVVGPFLVRHMAAFRQHDEL